MRCSIRRCFITSVGIGFLWLFITLKIPEEIEDDQNVMAIKGQVATLALRVGIEDVAWERCEQVVSQSTCTFSPESRKLQRELGYELGPVGP